MQTDTWTPRTVALAAMLLLFFNGTAHPLTSRTGEEYSADIGGSIRTYTTVIKNSDISLPTGDNDEYDGLSQTLLRLTGTGTIGTHGAFELHVVNELDFSTGPRASLLSASGVSTTGASRFRITNPYWAWVEDEDVLVFFTADRLNVKYSFPDVDITLGRQAVNFSEAYFWNPLDVFAPFDPQSFDRDYKPGVDALRMDINLGSFSSLSLVGATGRKLAIDTDLEVSAEEFGEDQWYASALLARYRANYSGWDISLQAGKVYGGYQAGAGFSGEAGPLGLRGEVAYVQARGDASVSIPDPGFPGGTRTIDLVEDHASLVLGVDHRFDNSLYVNIEYLYNGAGDDDDLVKGLLKSAVGETLSLSEHLAGFQVSYEFHPLLTGQAAWIVSLSDASSLLTPTMTCSVADEADFIFGAMLAFGRKPEITTSGSSAVTDIRSEFGTYPDIFFMEFKLYF